MSASNNPSHPDWQALVDHWFGDAEPAVADTIDAHLMACDACGAEFDTIAALSQGVREAFRQGRVGTVLTAAFVEQLKAGGRHVREYRVPAGGSVTCTVAPQDDLLVSRLDARLSDVRRLDAVFSFSFAPGQEMRLSDVPFDAQASEFLFAPKIAEVRRQPAHDFVVRLLAVDDAGEREIGRYTFHHRVAP